MRPNLEHIDPGNAGGSVVIPESPDYVPPARVPTFVCAQCKQRFYSADELIDHRFAQHPLRRPVLILDGHELLTPTHLVRRRLAPDGIALSNVSRCWLNGVSVDPADLSVRLLEFGNTLVSIRLESGDGPVESVYEIDISIPEPEHVAEVEKRFGELAAMGELDMEAIERFIQASRPAHTALGLVDAVSQYLYGVLAKDQRGGTRLTLEEGHARFNQALEGFAGYESELATVLTEVINFNQNAFNDGSNLTTAPELQAAMRRFYGVLHSDMSAIHAPTKAGQAEMLVQVPLDSATDRLIEWALMSDAVLVDCVGELSIALELDTWGSDDRFKVRILLCLALLAAGDLKGASEHARRLRNDAFFSLWAESIIERSKGD